MRKANLILPIAILFLVMTLYFVSAQTHVGTCAVNVPVTGGNYTSSITLQCTTDMNTSNTAEFNVTFWRSGSSGGDATTLIALVGNTSQDQTVFTYIYAISVVTDARLYNFTCEANNGTDTVNATGIYPVTIDNVACTGTATFTETEIDYGRSFTYNTSVTDATSGVQTSSCQIANPLGKYIGTVTTADTNKVFDEGTRTEGIWNITCNATDYSSNTCGFSDTLEVLAAGKTITPTPTGISGGISGLKETLNKTLFKAGNIEVKLWMALIVVVVIIVLASQKKK